MNSKVMYSKIKMLTKIMLNRWYCVQSIDNFYWILGSAFFSHFNEKELQRVGYIVI